MNSTISNSNSTIRIEVILYEDINKNFNVKSFCPKNYNVEKIEFENWYNR